MKEFVYAVVFCAIVNAIINIILPNGGISKFIKNIMGIFTFAIIGNAIVNLIMQLFNY